MGGNMFVSSTAVHHVQQPGIPGFPHGHTGAVSGELGSGEDKCCWSRSAPRESQCNDGLRPEQMHLGYELKTLIPALMYAAKNEQDFLCRTFGKCQSGLPLDREVGDMIGMAGPARPKLFTYMRYDADVTQAGLGSLGLDDIRAANVQAMDSVAHVADLQKLGRTVAAHSIRAEHYAAFLN